MWDEPSSELSPPDREAWPAALRRVADTRDATSPAVPPRPALTGANSQGRWETGGTEVQGSLRWGQRDSVLLSPPSPAGKHRGAAFSWPLPPPRPPTAQDPAAASLCQAQPRGVKGQPCEGTWPWAGRCFHVKSHKTTRIVAPRSLCPHESSAQSVIVLSRSPQRAAGSTPTGAGPGTPDRPSRPREGRAPWLWLKSSRAERALPCSVVSGARCCQCAYRLQM